MNPWIRYVFQKMLDGILYGLGISICFSVSSYLMVKVFQNEMDESLGIRTDRWSKFHDESSGLEVTEHREARYSDYDVDIVGVVNNTGSDSWESINVEVELFYKTKTFLGEYSAYIQSKLVPGESENFSINISNCKEDSLIPDFESYTIRIVNAAYVPE